MGLQAVRQSAVVLSVIVGCAIQTANAAEKYYKWVDQNGTTQYTQNPPPASARKVLKTVQVSTHIPADVRNQTQKPAVAEQPQAQSAAPSASTNTPPASSVPGTPDEPAIVSSDAPPPANY